MFVWMCAHVFMHARVCACLCVCACVCMYACVYIRARAHVRVHSCVCMRVCACVCTRVCVCMHMCARACVCACVHVRAYLSQLLVEVRGVDLGLLVALLVVQVQVPADEEGAQELLHLHGDVQRDGDDVVVEDQEGQEVRDELEDLEKGISFRYWDHRQEQQGDDDAHVMSTFLK